MALESLSSFSSTGTVSGTNTVNNTQKINTVAIGTGDITIDATKIPFSTSDSTNVNAKITSVDNRITSVDSSAVHKSGDETISGTKTFTPLTKFSEGISIVCDDGTTYEIRNGGNAGNELIIITNGKQSNGNNSILSVNANSVKIGSTTHNRVELGYAVEDDSNSNEVATTKWVKETSAVPTGTVITYAGIEEPVGYLLCDGRAVSRTQYSKLFEVISVTFGVGDGVTTFNLPKINDNRFIEYVSVEEFNAIKNDENHGLKDAGLPNITGELKGPGAVQEATGAFSAEGSGWYSDDSPDGTTPYIGFDASNCSDVYKNDITTVQPKSITLKAYIKYY
jgi:hypothetical protein